MQENLLSNNIIVRMHPNQRSDQALEPQGSTDFVSFVPNMQVYPMEQSPYYNNYHPPTYPQINYLVQQQPNPYNVVYQQNIEQPPLQTREIEEVQPQRQYHPEAVEGEHQPQQDERHYYVSRPNSKGINETAEQIHMKATKNELQETVKPKTCGEKMTAHKKILFCSIAVVVLFAALGVGLGVALSKKSDINDNKNDSDDTSPTVEPITCQTHPSECVGVPPAVSSFIFTNYTQPEQQRSLLQVSRSFSALPLNTTNLTRDSYVSAYRSITRSAECLSLVLPGGHTQAFQALSELQFSQQAELQQFLAMNEAFSGQPLRMTPSSSLGSTCQFNLSASTRRRLQSTPASNCSSTAANVLVYFNGIGYSPSAAIDNIAKMQEILSTNSSTNFDAGIVALGMWRKDNSLGFFMGLITAYQLLIQQEGSQVPDTFDLMACLRLILNLCTISARLPQSIAAEAFIRFREFFVQRSIESILNYQVDYNTAKHAQFVVQQISQGKKVVLVAHAQGTLYANKVYNLLTATQKTSVSLVYIAPTASTMADGRSNYITNPSDIVVLGMRSIALLTGSFPAPLPANQPSASFTQELDFGFNHELPGYAEAYKDQLTRLIVQAKARAVQPSRTLGNGLITVTLTWDSNPDVDLHIFEPQRHVYYPSRTGNNGFLDLDDTNGYGPEHYYTNCTLEQGDYKFKLNYYRGYSPSTAVVTVSAGPEYFMKTVTMPSSIGSSGDANPPYNICTVTVAWSETYNDYQFTITQ